MVVRSPISPSPFLMKFIVEVIRTFVVRVVFLSARLPGLRLSCAPSCSGVASSMYVTVPYLFLSSVRALSVSYARSDTEPLARLLMTVTVK